MGVKAALFLRRPRIGDGVAIEAAETVTIATDAQGTEVLLVDLPE